MDVMITLQPMNIVQAAADLLWSRPIKEYPDLKIGLVRGRHRLDPLFPGAGGSDLRDAFDVDPSGFRRQVAFRGFPRALPDLLHF